jgi:hypothetical protein
MRALRRDLIERRMWPLVALLLAALVGVPMMLLKGTTQASGAAGPVPPGVTVPSKTSSPGAVVVPVRLLKSRIPRNPFAAGNPKLAATPATKLPASTTASSAASSSSTTSSTSSTASMVSPTPTTSASTTPTAVSPSPSTGAATGTTTTASSTSTTASSTTTTAVTTPTSTAPAPAWTIYAVDVRYGKDANVPVRSDLARLALLPSAQAPAVMFMGVMTGGRQAVFALGTGVTHRGPGLCRPDHTQCSAILLAAGQTEQLTVPTASGGHRSVILRVVRIRSTVTHSRSVALAAFNRHSAAGQCDLELTDPVLYSSAHGTLSAAAAECRQQPSAVAFPHPVTGP